MAEARGHGKRGQSASRRDEAQAGCEAVALAEGGAEGVDGEAEMRRLRFGAADAKHRRFVEVVCPGEGGVVLVRAVVPKVVP